MSQAFNQMKRIIDKGKEVFDLMSSEDFIRHESFLNSILIAVNILNLVLWFLGSFKFIWNYFQFKANSFNNMFGRPANTFLRHD